MNPSATLTVNTLTMPALVQAATEAPGNTFNRIARAGGSKALQATLDLIVDNGHRMVLVKALNSPKIEGEVRSKIERILYGNNRQTPALFRALTH